MKFLVSTQIRILFFCRTSVAIFIRDDFSLHVVAPLHIDYLSGLWIFLFWYRWLTSVLQNDKNASSFQSETGDRQSRPQQEAMMTDLIAKSGRLNRELEEARVQLDEKQQTISELQEQCKNCSLHDERHKDELEAIKEQLRCFWRSLLCAPFSASYWLAYDCCSRRWSYAIDFNSPWDSIMRE